MKVRDTVVAYLIEQRDGITPSGSGNVSLLDILDSIEMLDFILFLESAFGMSIRDEDVTAGNFESLDGVIGFLEGRLQHAGD